jgi:hypothetical protein
MEELDCLDIDGFLSDLQSLPEMSDDLDDGNNDYTSSHAPQSSQKSMEEQDCLDFDDGFFEMLDDLDDANIDHTPAFSSLESDVEKMRGKEDEMTQNLLLPAPSELSATDIGNIFGREKGNRVYLKVSLVKKYFTIFPWFLIEHPKNHRYRQSNFSADDQELFRKALCALTQLRPCDDGLCSSILDSCQRNYDLAVKSPFTAVINVYKDLNLASDTLSHATVDDEDPPTSPLYSESDSVHDGRYFICVIMCTLTGCLFCVYLCRGWNGRVRAATRRESGPPVWPS